MTYNEPPEWAGRGARDRLGWPNETFNPGAPRSHRAPPDDTAESRPSRAAYHEEMPTDPAIEYRPDTVRMPAALARELVVPADPAPEVQHVILPIPRADDPVERFDAWLRVVMHMLGIVALVVALWVMGMVIADKGVPLWVPRS